MKMKKTAIVLTLLLAFSLMSFAQSGNEDVAFKPASTSFIGVKAGIGTGLDEKIWEFGFDSMFYLGKRPVIRVQGAYHGKKIKESFRFFSTSVNYSLFQHSLFLSVSFMLDINGWLPYVGLYVVQNLSGANHTIYETNLRHDIKLTSTTLGLEISLLTFSYSFKKSKLLFSVFSRISFGNLYERTSYALPANTFEGTASTRELTIQFSLSYLFGL
jgi:hypothetical protein